MNADHRLSDYLDHMQQAATDACDFVADMSKEEFLSDKKTQRAVIMCLIIIGEAVTKLMDGYPRFVEVRSTVPWRSIRGMRNRMAHGYFEINLDVVWDTIQTALPTLLEQLQAVQRDVAGYDPEHWVRRDKR